MNNKPKSRPIQDEEFVTDVYADASCWAEWGESPIYRIWSERMPFGDMPESILLGIGKTPELAWADAASKLVSPPAAQPEPDWGKLDYAAKEHGCPCAKCNPAQPESQPAVPSQTDRGFKCPCCGHKNFKNDPALCDFCFLKRIQDSKHQCASSTPETDKNAAIASKSSQVASLVCNSCGRTIDEGGTINEGNGCNIGISGGYRCAGIFVAKSSQVAGGVGGEEKKIPAFMLEDLQEEYAGVLAGINALGWQTNGHYPSEQHVPLECLVNIYQKGILAKTIITSGEYYDELDGPSYHPNGGPETWGAIDVVMWRCADAEKGVRNLCPAAESFNIYEHVCGVFARSLEESPIGVGLTEADAWRDAWERIKKSEATNAKT